MHQYQFHSLYYSKVKMFTIGGTGSRILENSVIFCNVSVSLKLFQNIPFCEGKLKSEGQAIPQYEIN